MDKIKIKDENKMEERAKELADILKVLANENRLLILCALAEQPLTVSEISERIDSISQSAISQHLSILRAHGILGYEKYGQQVTYYISDHRIEPVMRVLKEQYC